MQNVQYLNLNALQFLINDRDIIESLKNLIQQMPDELQQYFTSKIYDEISRKFYELSCIIQLPVDINSQQSIDLFMKQQIPSENYQQSCQIIQPSYSLFLISKGLIQEIPIQIIYQNQIKYKLQGALFRNQLYCCNTLILQSNYDNEIKYWYNTENQQILTYQSIIQLCQNGDSSELAINFGKIIALIYTCENIEIFKQVKSLTNYKTPQNTQKQIKRQRIDFNVDQRQFITNQKYSNLRYTYYTPNFPVIYQN